MKGTKKRILSWVILMAMVLSLFPVMGQPARATEQAQTGVRFPSDVTSYQAECAVCKKTVTWTPYHGENGSSDDPLTASSANGRYGYIPNTMAYDYGCYESYVGRYTRETGDELARTYVDMLLQLQ